MIFLTELEITLPKSADAAIGDNALHVEFRDYRFRSRDEGLLAACADRFGQLTLANVTVVAHLEGVVNDFRAFASTSIVDAMSRMSDWVASQLDVDPVDVERAVYENIQ